VGVDPVVATPTDRHEGGGICCLGSPSLLVVDLGGLLLPTSLAHRMFLQISLTHHRIVLKAFSLLFGYRAKGSTL